MANVKYTISFLPNDRELLEFVEKKRKCQNFSAYIRDLIRNDMGNQDYSNFEEVYLYVLKRIKEDGYAISESETKQINEIITVEDKDIIRDLF